MKTELSMDEKHYLMSAFAASPSDWFRPRTVDPHDFSDREIDCIVESLDRHGLVQARPGRHARLTDQGRKEATQLTRLATRDWRRFCKRRRVGIAVASTVMALVVSLVVLKWKALL